MENGVGIEISDIGLRQDTHLQLPLAPDMQENPTGHSLAVHVPFAASHIASQRQLHQKLISGLPASLAQNLDTYTNLCWMI